MTDDTKPATVTRGEFYRIVGGLYFMITFAFIGLALSNEQHMAALIAQFVMAVAAGALSLMYAILGVREQLRQTNSRKDLSEPGAATDRPST